MALGCALEDVDALEAGSDPDASPRPGGAGALGVGQPPATSVSVACVEEPTMTTCCTNELLTNGTALADVDVLDLNVAHCVFGFEGDDTYDAGNHADIMVGGSGNDTLEGLDADDTLIGQEGNDSLYGGDGHDWLYGSAGTDLLSGGAGNDHLHGGADSDVLQGSSGVDVLVGGMGIDQVYGHGQDDLIVIHHVCELGTSEYINGGDGHDIVIAPLDATGLVGLGVVLVGVEQVVVDTSIGHLAECGPPPPPPADEARSLSMRSEVDLGCNRMMPGFDDPACEDTWARTEARVWVDVPDTTTKFLATQDDSTAAITFSAHAVGNVTGNLKGARSPIHLRALVDGQPVEPGTVQLAFTNMEDPAVFTFVAEHVPRGIHNVRFQWMIEDDWFFQQFDDDPIGIMQGANVSVSVDSPHTEVAGVTASPAVAPDTFLAPGGLGSVGSWSAIEDPATSGPLTVAAYVREGATTTITFGAEIGASWFGTLDLRAKVDGLTAPLSTNVVRLGQRLPVPYWGTAHPSADDAHGMTSRSFTFVATGLGEGWHTFTFDGRLRIDGTESYPGEADDVGIHIAAMGTRSVAVVSTVDDPSEGVAVAVAAAESPIVGMPVGLEEIDGLSQTITVPEDSQVLVRFDGDIRDPWAITTHLMLDGYPVPGTERAAYLSSTYSAGTISSDYVLKRLPPGQHELAVAWEGPNSLVVPSEIRDRIMTVRVEPLHTPDLGRGTDMGGGSNGETLYRRSVQATDGELLMLPIIVDTERPQVMRVYFVEDLPGTYTLKIDGDPYSYTTGVGEGIDEVIDELVADINAVAGLDVTAEELDGALECAGCDDPDSACYGCVDELLLVADVPGPDVFTAFVDEAPSNVDGEVMKTLLASNPVAPSNIVADQMLFGLGVNPAASDAYWLQQSRGLFRLLPAYEEGQGTGGTRVVGPVAPTLTGLDAVKEYWLREYPTNCDSQNPDPDTYPFQGGHVRRMYEGLLAADAAFNIDFAAFDVDGDGVVRNDELYLVFINPQATASGGWRLLDPFCLDGGEPVQQVELDGVVLDLAITEWTSTFALSGVGYMDHAVAAHEIGHALGMDDMYIKKDTDSDGVADAGCLASGACTEHEAWAKSIMAAGGNRSPGDDHWSELDGFHKLSLGWVTPRTVTTSTAVELEPVTSGREVLILPREGSGGREYFLVENRVNRQMIAPMGAGYDVEIGIGDDGLAIWHIIEPEHAESWEFGGLTPPPLGCWEDTPSASTCRLMDDGHQCNDPQEGPVFPFDDETESYVRRGIRLLRSGPTGFGFLNGSLDLWNDATGDASNSGLLCGPGMLVWSDGTPSPYELTNLGAPGGTMTLCVEVDGQPCP